jgi:ABC-2 type transport system permease protein
VEGEMKSYPLAVAVQGSFESFFKGKPNPLTVADNTDANANNANAPAPTPTPATANQVVGTIDKSPDTARLVVIGSGEFVDDFVLQLSSRLVQNQILNNLQFVQNAVDWSVEDMDLLSIRSRGTYTRLLNPIDEAQQRNWEMGNYVVALLALILIGGLWYLRRRNERPMALAKPGAIAGDMSAVTGGD